MGTRTWSRGTPLRILRLHGGCNPIPEGLGGGAGVCVCPHYGGGREDPGLPKRRSGRAAARRLVVRDYVRTCLRRGRGLESQPYANGTRTCRCPYPARGPDSGQARAQKPLADSPGHHGYSASSSFGTRCAPAQLVSSDIGRRGCSSEHPFTTSWRAAVFQPMAPPACVKITGLCTVRRRDPVYTLPV